MNTELTQEEIDSLLNGIDNVFDEPVSTEPEIDIPVSSYRQPTLGKWKGVEKPPEHDFECGHCGKKMETARLLRSGGNSMWMLYCPTDKYYLRLDRELEKLKRKNKK